ncbi:hypothetical protein MRS44_016239 [Fusarium solani]|uniref:uncharacterized protein n=1 Tax=Fusarium solani TaxID=169388 RepID=UPI0032C45771|nr:hypothetical protein MRS44_016239 [Fusarium solani]
MSRDYSDLQVVPDRSYPEVVPQFEKDPTDKVPAEPPQQATPPRRICGLPPKRFWIIVVVVVLITGAVIGGASNLHRRPSHDRTYHLFRKRCNVGFAGSPDNVVNIPAKSLDDCINKCARYNEKNKTEIASRESNVCNSVCWRHRVTGDDWPGQCFGSTIQNSTSSGFPVDEDQIECDSGAWINQEIPGRDG